MNDNLTYEMMKRILADVGAVPGKYFGTAGLVVPELLLQKTIKVRYDDKDREHNIYAGMLKIKESNLRGILINLTVDTPEYIFIFRFDELPIHAVKVLFDEMDLEAYCKVYNSEKEIWVESSAYMKAKLLSEFERFVSWGILWEDCKNIKDLYDVTSTLI